MGPVVVPLGVWPSDAPGSSPLGPSFRAADGSEIVPLSCSHVSGVSIRPLFVRLLSLPRWLHAATFALSRAPAFGRRVHPRAATEKRPRGVRGNRWTEGCLPISKISGTVNSTAKPNCRSSRFSLLGVSSHAAKPNMRLEKLLSGPASKNATQGRNAGAGEVRVPSPPGPGPGTCVSNRGVRALRSKPPTTAPPSQTQTAPRIRAPPDALKQKRGVHSEQSESHPVQSTTTSPHSPPVFFRLQSRPQTWQRPSSQRWRCSWPCSSRAAARPSSEAATQPLSWAPESPRGRTWRPRGTGRASPSASAALCSTELRALGSWGRHPGSSAPGGKGPALVGLQ